MDSISAQKYSRLTKQARLKYLKSYLNGEFDIKGENLTTLDKAIEYIGKGHEAVSVFELIPRLGPWLEKIPIISVASDFAETASAFLFPVGAMINIVDALQEGQRMYGMRAVAYTTTAFAFNDVIPTGSPTIVKNEREGPIIERKKDLLLEQQAWKQSSIATLHWLDEQIFKRKGKKRDLQLLFRALGKGIRANLCLEILKGFEGKFEAVTRNIWRSGYSIQYPH